MHHGLHGRLVGDDFFFAHIFTHKKWSEYWINSAGNDSQKSSDESYPDKIMMLQFKIR